MSRRTSFHANLLNQHPDFKLLNNFFEEYPSEEILYNCWVKKVNDRGTIQDRLLIIGSSRIVTLKSEGVMFKNKKKCLARSGHLFGITRIESPNKKEISIFWPEFKISFQTPNVDTIICKIREAFYIIAWGFTQEEQFAITIDSQERFEAFVPPKINPKTAFFSTFHEMLKWKGGFPTPVFEGNLAKIIESENATISICPSTGPEINESLLSAIRHSPLIRSVEIPQGDQLGIDVLNSVKIILRTNNHLEEISIANVKENWQWPENIGLELQKNTKISIKHLKLINVPITKKGAKNLADALKKCKLSSLSLDNCELGAEEISLFAESLKNSENEIKSLNLSNNEIGMGFGTTQLTNCLSKLTNLQEICLANVNVNFVEVFNLILTHKSIKSIDISSNNFNEQQIESLQNLLYQTEVISNVNISNCNLNSQSLSSILRILKDNENGVNFNINASKNKLLSNDDVNALERVLSKITNLNSLVLNDCFLGDDGVQLILESLRDNPSIRSLSLKNNLPKLTEKGNAKQRENTSKELISFFSGKNQLKCLSLAGGSLLDDHNNTPIEFQFGAHLIDAIPYASKLKIFDISGNNIGEEGGAPILELIKTSSSLLSFHFDGNLLSLNTYREILLAMRENKIIWFVSPPIDEEKVKIAMNTNVNSNNNPNNNSNAPLSPNANNNNNTNNNQVPQMDPNDLWLRIATNIPRILQQTHNARLDLFIKYFEGEFLKVIKSAFRNRDLEAIGIMGTLEKILAILNSLKKNRELLSCLEKTLEEVGEKAERLFGLELIDHLNRMNHYLDIHSDITKGKVDVLLLSDEEEQMIEHIINCAYKFENK